MKVAEQILFNFLPLYTILCNFLLPEIIELRHEETEVCVYGKTKDADQHHGNQQHTGDLGL